MGLGPKWDGNFIQPAPPADASPEKLRYIAHLHDQLNGEFETVKDTVNRLVIGGDGDGGAGISETTETDGGTVPTSTNIVAQTGWGGSNHQWLDVTFGYITLVNMVGGTVTWHGDRFAGGIAADTAMGQYDFIATKNWTKINLWMATDAATNNGKTIQFHIESQVNNIQDANWRAAGTDLGQKGWIPVSGVAAVKKLSWVSTDGVNDIVAGEMVNLRAFIDGVTAGDRSDHPFVWILGLSLEIE